MTGRTVTLLNQHRQELNRLIFLYLWEQMCVQGNSLSIALQRIYMSDRYRGENGMVSHVHFAVEGKDKYKFLYIHSDLVDGLVLDNSLLPGCTKLYVAGTDITVAILEKKYLNKGNEVHEGRAMLDGAEVVMRNWRKANAFFQPLITPDGKPKQSGKSMADVFSVVWDQMWEQEQKAKAAAAARKKRGLLPPQEDDGLTGNEEVVDEELREEDVAGDDVERTDVMIATHASHRTSDVNFSNNVAADLNQNHGTNHARLADDSVEYALAATDRTNVAVGTRASQRSSDINFSNNVAADLNQNHGTNHPSLPDDGVEVALTEARQQARTARTAAPATARVATPGLPAIPAVLPDDIPAIPKRPANWNFVGGLAFRYTCGSFTNIANGTTITESNFKVNQRGGGGRASQRLQDAETANAQRASRVVAPTDASPAASSTAASASSPNNMETLMKEHNDIQKKALDQEKETNTNLIAKDLIQSKIKSLEQKADRTLKRMKMTPANTEKHVALSNQLDKLEEEIDEAEEQRKGLMAKILMEE